MRPYVPIRASHSYTQQNAINDQLVGFHARVLDRIFRIFSTKFSMLKDHPHNEPTPQ